MFTKKFLYDDLLAFNKQFSQCCKSADWSGESCAHTENGELFAGMRWKVPMR